jgi:cytochrome oxidase Cu insertion factor (SCO1/SenC/PrrC family)
MFNRIAAAFPILAGVLYTGIAAAQISPNERFAVAPEIGDMIPDLVIVDDQGNPANLRELTRGHYTVLTLGCLT